MLNADVIKEMETAKRALFALRTDYNKLITKVHQNEKFSFEEKADIADALNEMFKTKLGDAMENMAEMYKILTNKGINANE